MKSGVLLVVLTIAGAVLCVGPRSATAVESPDVVDAFSRLDALAEELAGRQHSLAESAGTASPSVRASPERRPSAAAVAQPAATADTGPDPERGTRSDSAHDESAACAPRRELSKTINALLERYDDHGRVIIAVNDELPMLRRAVLDMEHVCTERLGNHIGSALGGVEALDLAADYRVVERLTACVDRLREETDEELSRTASNIRMQRLAVEMEQLGRMTHRVADLERALLRGISKRDRLVQELGQFQQEIEVVCR